VITHVLMWWRRLLNTKGEEHWPIENEQNVNERENRKRSKVNRVTR
jgi:hypothetical protein